MASSTVALIRILILVDVDKLYVPLDTAEARSKKNATQKVLQRCGLFGMPLNSWVMVHDTKGRVFCEARLSGCGVAA